MALPHGAPPLLTTLCHLPSPPHHPVPPALPSSPPRATCHPLLTTPCHLPSPPHHPVPPALPSSPPRAATCRCAAGTKRAPSYPTRACRTRQQPPSPHTRRRTRRRRSTTTRSMGRLCAALEGGSVLGTSRAPQLSHRSRVCRPRPLHHARHARRARQPARRCCRPTAERGRTGCGRWRWRRVVRSTCCCSWRSSPDGAARPIKSASDGSTNTSTAPSIQQPHLLARALQVPCDDATHPPAEYLKSLRPLDALGRCVGSGSAVTRVAGW
jgi:hypothetical protein